MKEQNAMAVKLEIKELKKKTVMTKNVKQKRRYDVIRLSLQGYSNNEITAILDISLRQVYNLINLYNENGIEGLKLKYSPGRKTKLTAEQEKELYDVITKKLPKDVGFEPFCNRTAPLACRYVKTVFDVEFSERGMRDIFYRLNLSYTRPTYVLAKADTQKQAEFTEKLEKIKKNSE